MRKIIYASLILSGLYVGLSSHSGGAAKRQNTDRTNSPLAPNSTGCGTCHTGGTETPVPTIRVTSNGVVPETFMPNEVYDVKVKITGTQANAFGFQLVALDESDVKTGTLSVGAAQDVQIVTLGDVDYAEHTEKSTSGEWNFQWTAPDVGAGDVKFYFGGVAVNGTGNTTGDNGAFGETLSISEHIVGVAEKEKQESVLVNSIVENELFFKSSLKRTTVDVVNLEGKKIKSIANFTGTSLNLSDLKSGLYILQVQKNSEVTAVRFFKK